MRATRPIRKLFGCRLGATSVEFAVAGPILMAMFYGIVEFGHYAWSTIALSDAAKQGARYAMVHGASSPNPVTAADIAAYVKGRITLLDPNSVNVSATFIPNNNAGSAVAVTTSYTFVPFLPGFDILGSAQLAASSQLTIAQ